MLKYMFIVLLSTGLFMSCSKDGDSKILEDQFLEDVSLETRSGPGGCYELVFPIGITLPDASTIEVASFEEAKEQIRAWKENNPDVDGRPQLAFPIDLINEDGEIITAENREQLLRIKKECRKDQVSQGADRCFKFVYPLSIELPNGDIKEIESGQQFKRIIKDWRNLNPDVDRKPRLVYPLEVLVRGQDEPVTVNSSEELRRLKDDC